MVSSVGQSPFLLYFWMDQRFFVSTFSLYDKKKYSNSALSNHSDFPTMHFNTGKDDIYHEGI
jgi:hypothetical protein